MFTIKMKSTAQAGFALIVSMIVLAVLSILVINAVRSTTLSEKMSGNYMDRALAQQAAEQALRQGEALLLANGETCVSGCSIPATGNVAASSTTATMASISWSDASARDITKPTGQATSAKYMINLLPDTDLPAAKLADSCKAYSIMGQGKGLDSRSVVVLQTVAFICPI